MGKRLKSSSDICKLEQKIKTTQKDLNLAFWYYQYGSQIGNLKLIINQNKTIWESNGRQKNEWLFVSVVLPANSYHVNNQTKTFSSKLNFYFRLNLKEQDQLMVECQVILLLMI